MTFRAWMEENHPEKTHISFTGGCKGCPCKYFDIDDECPWEFFRTEDELHRMCWDCWGREIPDGVEPRS